MNRALSAALLFLLALSPDQAQGRSAMLVGDFDAASGDDHADSNPGQFADLGERVVFVAQEPSSGFELWVTDGTPAGTRILEDICPGECSPTLEILGVAGGVSFWFVAPELRGPGQLWRSDGTEPGTYRLDLPFALADPENEPPLLLGGALYFGDCSAERGCELWRSDGTVAGTKAVKTIDASSNSFGRLVPAGKRFYFTAGFDPVSLWISDGTAAGTRQVTEFPHFLGLMTGTANGRLFFAFGDEQDGSELWVSDGTGAGTRSLTDFEAPSPFTDTEWMKPVGNRVYLLLNDVDHGQEIWRSDGTEKGTQRVTEFGVYAPFGNRFQEDSLDIDEIDEIGGRVVFRATDGLGPDQLWVSDGAPESTAPLGGLRLSCTSSRRFIRAGGRVFLPASDGAHGCALWSTDGTAEGTRSFAACNAGSDCLLDDYQGAVLFLGRDTNGRELWLSDGTAAGTHRLTDMPGSAEPAGDFGWNLAGSGDRLFFSGSDGHGTELWMVADGQTRLVANIARAEPSSLPKDLAPFGDRLFFTACDGKMRETRISTGTPETTADLPGHPAGDCSSSFFDSLDLTPVQAAGRLFYIHDDQLWSTDGTPGGATQLHFISPDQAPPSHVAFQGMLFFQTQIGENTEIWKSDGTPLGTVKAFELPDTGSVSLTAVGSELYFTAYQNGGYDAWRSDGTQAGTRKLTSEVNPGDPGFTRAGSSVFFTAEANDPELWKTDGTVEGTVRVSELPGHRRRFPRELTEHQGKLYFFASTDGGTSWSLWRSDGAAAGTVPLRSFSEDLDSLLESPTFHLVSFAGRLYFAADGNDGLGNELWTSDGTAAGTVILRDILPGVPSSQPSWLTVAGGRLYFAAHDGEHGNELWSSDGSAAGTRLEHDLAPEDVSSYPDALTATSTHLYFLADDGLSGRELWSLPLAGPGCQPSPHGLCLGGRYRVEATWKDFQGNTGRGTAVAVTPDTGYFWFFGPANVEVIVKVLDGTGLNGHRWVFYGALSSVEFTLTVTDTQTGLTRRYFNPAGQLASVGDTNSFGPLGAFSTVASGPCQPTEERLCLNGGRFAVEADWKDFQGKTGKGKAVSLTADTGYFWFFDAANVEVVLKVLDGTSLNGKHWVFYGALSSVEYTLTVTDTQTGVQRIYTNPSGKLGSVADTGAF